MAHTSMLTLAPMVIILPCDKFAWNLWHVSCVSMTLTFDVKFGPQIRDADNLHVNIKLDLFTMLH